MPDQRSPDPAAPADAVPRSAWVLLGVMTGLNVLNFVDRQLIASLAPLLIADLGLTRSQIGLLVGFAFVVFYTLVGMVLGVAADRWSRRTIIAWGLALWSVMTALSGAARGFLHLAVPRVFVGVGEATLTPAALSMLGDAFPTRRLGLATGTYYTGLPIGTALSLGVAGWAAPRFGWRVCFYGFGAIGLAAVALLFAVREPARRAAAGVRAGT
jgi:MFS family permease